MSDNFSSSLESLFSKMETFISSKTVIGEPFNIGDVIILPLVDVAFGVGAGSLDNKVQEKNKDGSAGGLGAKITPSAVLVIKDGTTQLVNIKNQDSINKLIDMAPGILSKIPFLAKDNNDKEENITNITNEEKNN